MQRMGLIFTRGGHCEWLAWVRAGDFPLHASIFWGSVRMSLVVTMRVGEKKALRHHKYILLIINHFRGVKPVLHSNTGYELINSMILSPGTLREQGWSGNDGKIVSCAVKQGDSPELREARRTENTDKKKAMLINNMALKKWRNGRDSNPRPPA